MEGNTGASTRDKSCEKILAGHWRGGGLNEETTSTRDGRWQHLQPREGERCLVEKNKVELIQHTKDKILHADPYIALYHVTREQGTLVAPRL